jgi:hypothetical protein
VKYVFQTGGKGVAGSQVLVVASGSAAEVRPDYLLSAGVPDPEITAGAVGQLDTDGLAYTAIADGASVEVTSKTARPLATSGPGANAYRLHLYWNGTDVTGSNVTAIVGQYIGLTCSLVGSPGSTPSPITNYSWSVPGITFSDYVASASSGILYTAFPKTNSEADYYWVDGGRKQVSCTVQVKGQTLAAQTTFNVNRPSVDWVGTIQDAIAADANYANAPSGTSFPYLHFGGSTDTNGNTRNGIVFTASNLSFDGSYTGNTFFCTQVGSGLATHCQSSGDSVHISFSGVDHTDKEKTFEDFTNNSTGTWQDSPGSPIGNSEVKIFRSNNFDTYLMFQPPSPSRPVPLRKISWNWTGAAVPNVSQPGWWTLVSSNAVITANNEDAFSHPVWTSNMDNQISITNNLCQ